MKTRLRSRLDWVALNPQPLPPRYVIALKPIPKPEPDPFRLGRFGSGQQFF